MTDFETIARDRITWETTPSLQASSWPTAAGTIQLRRGHFHDGRAAGVEVVRIDSGAVKLMVLPTRGMGIWKIEAAGQAFGWQSPVAGPVHPHLVPVLAPDGLGWLEGFDELLVRCGLESNGAPEFDANERLAFPLHGRIANLPASNLQVAFDESTGRLTLTAEVLESRLFFKRLRLKTRLTVTAGKTAIEIEDEVVNERAVPATAQLLYHINLGAPLLGDGARVHVQGNRVTGKDETSAAERAGWNQIGPPQPGYRERVYFIDPQPPENQPAAAALIAADQQSGFGITFDAQTLPQLIFWKNTAAIEDGYVVGIEPATNLPNTRSEEAAAGRVIHLAPGASQRHRVTLEPLVTASAVTDFATANQLDA